mmetsp:Transcript_18040/g.36284  ORF Transcript_18040/g.36284 Transcript_18040/m.36284 type:complete len:455 (-) Transcript_18040:791-2155(-)
MFLEGRQFSRRFFLSLCLCQLSFQLLFPLPQFLFGLLLVLFQLAVYLSLNQVLDLDTFSIRRQARHHGIHCGTTTTIAPSSGTATSTKVVHDPILHHILHLLIVDKLGILDLPLQVLHLPLHLLLQLFLTLQQRRPLHLQRLGDLQNIPLLPLQLHLGLLIPLLQVLQMLLKRLEILHLRLQRRLLLRSLLRHNLDIPFQLLILRFRLLYRPPFVDHLLQRIPILLHQRHLRLEGRLQLLSRFRQKPQMLGQFLLLLRRLGQFIFQILLHRRHPLRLLDQRFFHPLFLPGDPLQLLGQFGFAHGRRSHLLSEAGFHLLPFRAEGRELFPEGLFFLRFFGRLLEEGVLEGGEDLGRCRDDGRIGLEGEIEGLLELVAELRVYFDFGGVGVGVGVGIGIGVVGGVVVVVVAVVGIVVVLGVEGVAAAHETGKFGVVSVSVIVVVVVVVAVEDDPPP